MFAAPTIRKIVNSHPYPGLRAFRADEAHLFFGRDDQVDKLLEKLQYSHFVAVVGPSGCGKSSLVKAGLIPALRSGFLMEEGSKWKIVEMRPGAAPYNNLSEELCTAFRGSTAKEYIKAELKRSPKGLIELLRSGDLPRGENFLLIVDQFEELFRYKRNENIDEVTAFISLLIESSSQREVSIHVVITMRSDFLGDASLFPGLPEILNDNQFLTPRLTREQTKEAIEGPAWVCGGYLENQLVTTLLNDIGVDHDQLPLLQNSLMIMWSNALEESGRNVGSRDEDNPVVLTISDYDKIGKIKSALSDHADKVYEKLSEKQRAIAEIMFKRLTERSLQQKDIRVPSKVSEIAAIAKVSDKEVIEVADLFRAVTCNFIVPDNETKLRPETYLDISHESLMRQWNRMKKWVTEEYESANKYKRLLLDANNYFNRSGELLQGINLYNALKWQKESKPNEAWADRYAQGELPQVLAYLRKSKTKYKRDKIRGFLLLAFLMMSLLAIAYGGYQMQQNKINEQYGRIREEQEKDSLSRVAEDSRDSLRATKSRNDIEMERRKLAEIRVEKLEFTKKLLEVEKDKFENVTLSYNSHFHRCVHIDSMGRSKAEQLLQAYLHRDDTVSFRKTLNLLNSIADELDVAETNPTLAFRGINKIVAGIKNYEEIKDYGFEEIILKFINSYLYNSSWIEPAYSNLHTTSLVLSPSRDTFVYNIESFIVKGRVVNGDSLVIHAPHDLRKTPHLTSLAMGAGNEILGIARNKLVRWKNDRKTIFPIPVDTNSFSTLAPNGNFLATYSISRGLVLWGISGGEKKEFELIDSVNDLDGVYAFTFSRDSKFLVIGYKEGCRVLNTKGETIAALRKTDIKTAGSADRGSNGYSFTVTAVNFSADSKKIILATSDRNVMMWYWMTGRNVKKRPEIGGITNEISNIYLSPDESRIIVKCNNDPHLIFSDINRNDLRLLIDKDTNFTYCDFLRDDVILTADYTGNIRTWRIYPKFTDARQALHAIRIAAPNWDERLMEFREEFEKRNEKFEQILASNNRDSLKLAAEYYYIWNDDKGSYNESKQLALKLWNMNRAGHFDAQVGTIIIKDNYKLIEIDSTNYFGNADKLRENISLREKVLEHDSSKKVDLFYAESLDYISLSWNQLFLKDFRGAVNSANLAIKLDTSDADPMKYKNLALAYLLTHDFGKFEEYFKRAMKESTEHSEDVHSLALTFLDDLEKLREEGIIPEHDADIAKELGHLKEILKM